MQTSSPSTLPGYTSRRSSSVSVFHESSPQPDHAPIGIGITGLQSRTSKVDNGKRLEPSTPVLLSMDHAVHGTPPPNYSSANISEDAPAPSTKIAAATPQETWITAKEIGAIRNLPYLTGMRAIATIIIELSHVSKEGTSYIYYFAWIALTTHFVQGAFLIAGSLLSLQAKKRKSSGFLSVYEHLPQFFLARWVRLYPAMILVLAINSIWWLPRYDYNWSYYWRMIARVFLKISQTKILPLPKGGPPVPFANMWFLDVQELGYIFWGLTLPLIAWFRTGGRIVCLAIIFALSFRQRLKEGHFNATLPLNLYKMVFGVGIFLLPLPRAFVMQYASQAAVITFVAGTIWGVCPRFDKGFTEDQHRMYGDNVGILLVVLVTFAAIAKGLKSADPEYQRQQKEHQAQRAVEDANQPWLAVLIHKFQDWEPLSLLDAQWLQFVGRISYSWYLWQVPLMHYESKFRNGKPGFGPTSEAFILALFSTWFIEEPIRNVYVAYLKRQRLPKPDSKAALTQPPSTKEDNLFNPNHHISLQMPLTTATQTNKHTD